MNYANDENDYNKLDEVITDKNVRVIVDKAALMFLIGTEMDFVEDEIRSEFVFNNPNSKGECGCGESFTV
jgi:iron-sulfur cluster assembly protein